MDTREDTPENALSKQNSPFDALLRQCFFYVMIFTC